ncbi:MAG: TlpA disulfide reductase family protein [Candidatus Rickettsia vulgarisii]
MNSKKYKYFSLIIIFLYMVSNCFAMEQIRPGIKKLDLSNVPDSIIFFDEKGEKYSLDKFEGRTILLVFWATWCASCIKEMPDLDVLQKDFRKLPFEIIPVSQDYQGIEVVKKYYQDNNLRYLPIYHDFKNQLFKAFSIVGLPTAILISPEGKMLVSFVGYINWYEKEVRDVLLEHIPGNHHEPKNSYQEQSLNQPVNNGNLKPSEQLKDKEEKAIEVDNKNNNSKEEKIL